MTDPDPTDRLKALDARIKAAKAQDEPESPMGEHVGQAQMAWRMVTELLAGIGIGFGIGYGLDSLFGTVPWLMMLFTLLGLAAGIKTMMRTAAEVQTQNQAAEAANRNDPAAAADKDERDDDGS